MSSSSFSLAALPSGQQNGLLDGRSIATQQTPIIDATTDDEAMAVWLRAKAHGSADTERAYRREGMRWRAWLDHCRPGARLNEATLTDGQDFVAWLGRPTLLPASALERWGMTRQPINSALGPAALGQAVSILSGLYATLQGVRGPGGHPFAQFDPFAIAKGPVKKQSRLARLTRTGAETALPQSVFREVVAQVEALPRKLPKEIEVYWRTWWAVRLCYFSLFRRSEVVGGLMGDFQKTQDGWVLHVVGKGSKPAALPVLPPLLEALQTYRRAMGLTPLPSPHEQTPIVLRKSPKRGLVAVSPSTVYRDMTQLFRETADRLDESGQAHEAAHLRAATVHTLRHTGVTHLLDAGADPRYVQSLARHGSLTTTSIYDHREERALRAGLDAAARLLVSQDSTQAKHGS